MKNDNRKNIIIGLLLSIIVILIALIVLLATGTISFKPNLSNDNQTNENSDTNQEYENQTNDSSNKNIQNNITNKGEVDKETLNKLYSMIGILPISQYYQNNCLNMAISNNNYKENFKSIFSWYALLMSLNTNHSEDAPCKASDECQIAYSCAACRSITKKDAEEILRIYNYNNDISNFLTTLPAYNDEYSYSSHTNQPSFCEYDIEHNTTSEYFNSTDIRITDNQNITEYEFASDYVEENIKNTKTQTVIYEFTKDKDGNYYLNNVEVK